MGKKKPKEYRLTIIRPTGDIAYDRIVTAGDKADVSYNESIDFGAIDAIIGNKKQAILTRTWQVKIKKLD